MLVVPVLQPQGRLSRLGSLLKGYSRTTLDKGIRRVLEDLQVEAEQRAATA
jgi:hypothetical protein